MLGTVDLVLLALFLVITIGIGVYHSVKGRKATTTEYMLGGRSMSPLPLAMSMTMGTISSVTVMGNIGEMYAYGTQLWIMDVGVAIGMVMVAKMFIPIFFPMNMVSVYQYIEERFSCKWLRIAAVLINILAAFLFLGFLLYPPSLFLVSFTGLSQITNIFIMGLTCGLYSAFGGVKAVVHTDVVQSVVMLIGVLAIVIQCIINVGGLDVAWQIASDRGRIEFFNMNMSPYQRNSFFLTLVFGLFFSLSTYGVTQSQIQRTFSTGSVVQAQRVIYYAIVGMLVLRLLINLAGVVIFAYFADCDPLTSEPDKPKPSIVIVIVYVLQVLTKIPGLAGLFVASIYAAVLSSVSTQVNSMTALFWEDFMKGKPCFANWTETEVTTLQKFLVFLTSIVGIVACIALVFIDSPAFITTLLKLTGAISGPMVGLFLTGLYLPWVNGRTAAFGFVISIALSFWIVSGQLLYEAKPPYLPMSRAGCPVSPVMSNSSLNSNVTEDYILDDSTTFEPTTINSTDSDLYAERPVHLGSHPVYGLSYCLNFCWGTLITVVLSVVATLLTGWNTPETLQQKLIAPSAWSLFLKLGVPSFTPPLQKLWRHVSGRGRSSYTTNGGTVHQDELLSPNYRQSDHVTLPEESVAMNTLTDNA